MGFAVRRGASAIYEHPRSLASNSTAYTRFSGIGYETGSVHSDFGISRLDTGGAITAHVHSFEETFYVMDGEVLVATPEATVRERRRLRCDPGRSATLVAFGRRGDRDLG